MIVYWMIHLNTSGQYCQNFQESVTQWMSSAALILEWATKCVQHFEALIPASSYGAAILIILTSVKLKKALH